MNFTERTIADEKGNEYRLSGMAGSGGQGAVFFVNNNSRIVIKAVMHGDEIKKDAEFYKKYKERITKVMACSNADNLASPICMLAPPYCGYVMRFMENMQPLEDLMLPKKQSLAHFYNETGGLLKRYKVLRNAARVLSELYENGLVYADISPKNIFVSKGVSDYEAWLIDVDNLHYCGDDDVCIGTPMYTAPEVFMGAFNTLKSDVYSFALVAFELLTMSKPFEGDYQAGDEDAWDADPSDSDDFYTLMARGDVPLVGTSENNQVSGLPIDLVMTKEVRNVFERTLGEKGRKNPACRPTMSEWFDVLNVACSNLVKNSCGHYGLSNTCYLCGEKGSALNISAYDVREYYTEGDAPDEVKTEQSEHKACTVRIPAADTSFVLPWFLLGIHSSKKSDFGVDVRKKKNGYEFDVCRDGVKLYTEPKNPKQLTGLKIYVTVKGNLVRILRFSEENQ